LDTEKIRVVIAEDHRIIRQGLVSVVSEQPDIEVVGEASNGREARIIGLSMYDDEQVQRAMAEAGAETFVNKADTSGILLRAIYGISEDV
jgi:two-component system, NarL family, response regulator